MGDQGSAPHPLDVPTGAAVKRFFAQWCGWAVRSRLDPVKKVAGMLKRHLDGVLRFVKHPITNGVAEGLNSKIMSIKRLDVSSPPQSKEIAARSGLHVDPAAARRDGPRQRQDDPH